MSRPVRFSIVTPSYNQAPFIAETVQSVLTQEGDFEIEYLVMDGGSTDGSVDVIRHHADQVASGAWVSRCAGVTMVWDSQPDRGQADAINRGLRRARGDVVAYLNSDDTYLPGALQAVARTFADTPEADIVYGDGDVVGGRGELLWEWRSRSYDQRLMTTYYFLWNSFTNFVMQQATFWQRAVHDRIGLFDESFHFVMDAEYWIRASAAGLRLQHLQQKLATFRMVDGTKSLSSPTVFWEDYLEIFRRYRGARAMEPYFGYYYYNLARFRDFDLDLALADGSVVFSRWESLAAEERKVLHERSARGLALACLLAARDLLGAGRMEEAKRVFRRGIGGTWTSTAYLAAADYLVGRLIGPRAQTWLDGTRRELVNRYKRGRYDCRHDPATRK
jgi:glycosyltransferase involved in cell wall biosynthesis